MGLFHLNKVADASRVDPGRDCETSLAGISTERARMHGTQGQQKERQKGHVGEG